MTVILIYSQINHPRSTILTLSEHNYIPSFDNVQIKLNKLSELTLPPFPPETVLITLSIAQKVYRSHNIEALYGLIFSLFLVISRLFLEKKYTQKRPILISDFLD